jgi:hypothetical protein
LTARLLLDRYIYEDIYPAFKANTDEKEVTARIVSGVLNELSRKNLVLTGDDPAAVADIGCGPCDTLVKYLAGVSFRPGFIVRATDYLDEYANDQRGEALTTLAAAQARGLIKLDSFAAHAGDAFGGGILNLLSGKDDEARLRNRFRIVFVSHMIYHGGTPAQVRGLLGGVGRDVLASHGLCMLFHLGNTRATFQDFRSRFGGEIDAHSDSNTGAVTIDDPPARIRTACAESGLPLYEAEFVSGVRFSKLTNDEWNAFKQPQQYDAIAKSNPDAYEDLKRLYFVVQRAPLKFAADHSRRGLDAFIDEARQAIEANGAVLPMMESIQVFTRLDAEPGLADAIPAALARNIESISGRA